MNYFLWYLFVMADNIRDFFISISVLSGVISIITFIFMYADDSMTKENIEKILKILKISVPIFIISLIFTTFVPNTKQIATIYIGPKIVNQENIDSFSKEYQEFYHIFKKYMIEKTENTE